MLYAALAISLIVPTQGRFSQYAPGVMERVIAYRQSRSQLPLDLSRYDGFIAVRECWDIGKEFVIRVGDTWELFLATDCASKSDHQSADDPRSGYQWMIQGNILAEVDWETAVRWNAQGKIVRGEMIRGGLKPESNVPKSRVTTAPTPFPSYSAETPKASTSGCNPRSNRGTIYLESHVLINR